MALRRSENASAPSRSRASVAASFSRWRRSALVSASSSANTRSGSENPGIPPGDVRLRLSSSADSRGTAPSSFMSGPRLRRVFVGGVHGL